VKAVFHAQSLSLSGKTEVNHLIPTLGFSIPLTARYNRSESTPKYLSQSDVEISDEKIRESQKTLRDGYTVTMSLNRRGSRNPLMKHFFDNLKAGASYSNNKSSSPTVIDSSWSYSWNTNYQIQFSKDRKLNLPFLPEFSYWLTNFSVNASGSKSLKKKYAYSGDRFIMSPTSFSHGWNNEMSLSYDPFESVKVNFRRSEKRNMLNGRTFHGIPVGRLVDYRQNFELQYQPIGNIWFISQFNPRFEYTCRYSENLNPSVRKSTDPEETRDASNDSQINVVFDVDVGKYAIDFGRLTRLLGDDYEAGRRKPSSSSESLSRQQEEFRKKITSCMQ